jgi:hypothetical protein
MPGDFNSDARLDIVVTNGEDNSISVLLGNGDGTLQNQIMYATGLAPVSVTVSDFNNDAKLDLAVANLLSNSVSILLNSCS